MLQLQIEHLHKRYGSQLAVNDIHFSIEPGQLVGFLGPNGAGKSTTLKIITGYVRPTSGTVRVGEFDVNQDVLAIRRVIGYLPEHNPLYHDLYVHELLSLVGRLHQMPSRLIKERIQAVIQQTGLLPEQHKKIGALSKGYRKRVGIAQALLHDPEILILDEPTDGLDPNQVLEIRALIRSFLGKKTVLFSSHILTEVEAIAQRVIIIHQGKLLTDIPIDQIGSALQQGQYIDVVFAQAGFDFSPILAASTQLQLQSTGENAFRLYFQSPFDPKPLIYSESVRQGIAISQMAEQTAHLEDIFRQLTVQPQA